MSQKVTMLNIVVIDFRPPDHYNPKAANILRIDPTL